MERRRLERPTSSLQSWIPTDANDNPETTYDHGEPGCSANNSARKGDTRLSAIVDAWPRLPDAVRNALVEITRASTGLVQEPS